MGRVLTSRRKIKGTNTERDKEEGKQKKFAKASKRVREKRKGKRILCVSECIHMCCECITTINDVNP